jgi:hypothetical protein
MQAGLFYFPNEFLAMTELLFANPSSLGWAEKRGLLFGSKEAGPLIAGFPSLMEKRDLQLQPTATTVRGAQAVLDFVRSRKAMEAQMALPDRARITGPYLEAGFAYSDWGRHVVIVQRRLTRRRKATSRARRRAAR